MEALRRRRQTLMTIAVAVGLLLGLLAVVYVVGFLPRRAEPPHITASVFDAELIQHLPAPATADGQPAISWNQPSTLAILDGSLFVLDTANDRILRLDDQGTVQDVIGGKDGEQSLMHRPLDLASDGQYLYVASSDTSEIVVLSPEGDLVSTITLDKTAPGDAALPRPIGIAITAGGDILVSDASNHRLLRYDRSGQLLQAIGTGQREWADRGFNVPAGIALGPEGDIHVVDILNGRVAHLAPDGAYLSQLGELGDTAGTFSRPKDVILDTAGNVYVSDSLLLAVHVFGPEGDFLGFIGRSDPGDKSSAPLFRAPAGLAIDGDRLYVMDRFLGLFVFQLP